MDKDTKTIITVIIILLLLLFVKGCPSTTAEEGGAGPSLTTIDEVPAIEVVFADKDKNEISQSTLQSLIEIGGRPPFEAFFIRFKINAENTGAVDIRAKPILFKAYNGNMNEVQQSEVGAATSCLLDEPEINIPNVDCVQNSDCGGAGFKCNTLTSNCYYTWDSNPNGGNALCSDNAWLSLVPFEAEGSDRIPGNADDISQPITFIVTLNGEYISPLTLLSKTIRPTGQLSMNIFYKEFSLGGLSATIDTGDKAYLAECTSGQIANCGGADITGSVCYGLQQECLGSAEVWPGCTLSLYTAWGSGKGRGYNPGYENTGGKVMCTDGFDNDCDGYADRSGAIALQSCTVDANCFTDAQQTCVGGKCNLLKDQDCPTCFVRVRTSANIDCYEFTPGTWTCNNDKLAAYYNKFLIVDINNDGFINSLTEDYGWSGDSMITSSGDCMLTSKCINNPTYRVTTTPGGLGINKVSSTNSDTLYICEYKTPGDIHTCNYYYFSISSQFRCRSGDVEGTTPIYPACISPLPQDFWATREKCEIY